MLFRKKNKNAKKVKNEKGSTLLLSLVMILGMVILGTNYVLSVHSNSQISVRTYTEVEAMYIAEAGAELGLLEVNHGGRDFLVTDGWIEVTAGSEWTRNKSINISGGAKLGEFDVTVIKLIGEPKSYSVISVGYFPDKTNPMFSKTVKVLAVEEKIFKDAIMGYGGIDVGSGALVDSYDSRIGKYNVSGNIGTDANFITNSSAANSVQIGNASVVTGDVTIGTGGVEGVVIQTTGTGTYGGVKWLHKDKPKLSIPDQTGVFGTIPYGPLIVAKDATYKINVNEVEYDSITLKKNAKLIINANTNIYVIGGIDLGVDSQIEINPGISAKLWVNGNTNFDNGATIDNTTHDPLRFKIYCTNNVASFDLSQHSAGFYGNIYAPNADVTIGNGTVFYGSVVGKSVKCTTGLQYHYDIASRYDSDPNALILGYFVTVWQEYTTP